MLCKVHNRDRIREDRILTVERKAIYSVKKVIAEYSRRYSRALDIRYLSLDIQEDQTIEVAAYSCDGEIAVLAPEALAEFTFKLRYRAEFDLVMLDAQDVQEWHQVVAKQLYQSSRHWEQITPEALQNGTRADAAAYLLHKMSRTGRSIKDCVALLKLTGLSEPQT